MTTYESDERPNLGSLDVLIHNYKRFSFDSSQLSLLKSYRKSQKITYEYAKDSTFGRQYSKSASLQSFKRSIRHTLCDGYYHDHDIVNCHPTLFVQYCEKKGYPCEAVKHFNSRRDEYLAELPLPRDEAKDLVLSILNGGRKAYSSLEERPDWLIDYKTCVVDVHNRILKDPELSEIKSFVVDVKGKKYNIAASMMNIVLCKVENECLMSAISFCKSRGVNLDGVVLVFDGFMTREPLSHLYSEMSDYIYDQTGYRIKWISKPFDHALDLSECEIPVDQDLNDMSAFELVIKKFSNIIKKCQNTIMIFNGDTGIWSTDHKDTMGLWYKLCQDALRGTKYGTQVKSQQVIFNLCSTLPDSQEFFERGRIQRLGKILYKDCVWNMDTDSKEPFNPEYYFTRAIPRNRGSFNQEMYDKVFKILFEDTHEDPLIRNEIWKSLSVAGSGRNPARCFINNIGPTRCGKSTIINHIIRSFPGYADSISLSSFVKNKFSKANDHNDALLKFEHNRWIFASEQPGGGVIDHDLVKQYTGGDRVSPRGCGTKSVSSFCPDATLITVSNSPLAFDKYDEATLDRLKVFEWTKQFPVDDTVNTTLLDDKACEAMDHIIQRGYNLWLKEKFIENEKLDSLKNDIKCEHNSIEDVFKKKFELCNVDDISKWMRTTDVYPHFKISNESEWNIKRKLETFGVICKKSMRGLHGQCMYFMGLTLKINEDEEEER
jgi:hypothetical protein